MSASVLDLSDLGYLGLRHVPEELRPWDWLSIGRPPAVEEVDPLTDTLAVRMAALQGCEAATFATSTFHLYWDFFDLLSDEEVVIYLEERTYRSCRKLREDTVKSPQDIEGIYREGRTDSFLSSGVEPLFLSHLPKRWMTTKPRPRKNGMKKFMCIQKCRRTRTVGGTAACLAKC